MQNRKFFHYKIDFRVSPNIPIRFQVWAGLAQLAELLICNQVVGGSIPLASSI